MGTVFTGIVAFMKAVPIIDSWFKQLQEAYVKDQINGMENRRVTKNDQRTVLIQKLTESKDKNEKIVLFSAINDLDRVPVNSN